TKRNRLPALGDGKGLPQPIMNLSNTIWLNAELLEQCGPAATARGQFMRNSQKQPDPVSLERRRVAHSLEEPPVYYHEQIIDAEALANARQNDSLIKAEPRAAEYDDPPAFSRAQCTKELNDAMPPGPESAHKRYVVET